MDATAMCSITQLIYNATMVVRPIDDFFSQLEPVPIGTKHSPALFYDVYAHALCISVVRKRDFVPN